MDDFILLAKTKNDCIFLKKSISIFLEQALHLKLNEKSKYYPHKMGINFCGYRIFTTHLLLRNSSKQKIKNNVRIWNKKYYQNKLDFSKTLQSIQAWIGHSSHCNSYNLQNKILEKCDFLLTNKSYEKLEKELLELNSFSNSKPPV